MGWFRQDNLDAITAHSGLTPAYYISEHCNVHHVLRHLSSTGHMHRIPNEHMMHWLRGLKSELRLPVA